MTSEDLFIKDFVLATLKSIEFNILVDSNLNVISDTGSSKEFHKIKFSIAVSYDNPTKV